MKQQTTILQLTLEKTRTEWSGELDGRVRAILFEGKRVVAVAEADDFHEAVEACVAGFDLSAIGVQDANGVVSVPDEISLSEAAEARYL